MAMAQDNSSTNIPAVGAGTDRPTQLRSAMLEVVGSVADFLASKQDDSTARESRRQNIVFSATKLLVAAKDPADQLGEGFFHGTQDIAIRVFYDWKVFDRIPPQGSVSYEYLARGVDAEVSLIRRFAGILVATGVLEQLGSDQVAHTPKSLIFVSDHPIGAFYETISYSLAALALAPAFFEKYGRKEPQSLAHVPVPFAYGHPELSFFELLAMDPPRMERYFNSMEYDMSLPTKGTYDLGGLAEKAQAEPERAVLVDFGGGKGHALAAILQDYPGLPRGRCVLEDRDEVIEVVEEVNDTVLSGVKKMAADFDTDQPVKGAMAYWIRRCLHNHSDTLALNILRILAEAMHDDSRLLIVEDIMENPPSVRTAVLDILMSGVGGKERTRDEWERLTAKAGLKIHSVVDGLGGWAKPAVIECVRDKPADNIGGAEAEYSAENITYPESEQQTPEVLSIGEAGRPEGGRQALETSSSDTAREGESNVSSSSRQEDRGE